MNTTEAPEMRPIPDFPGYFAGSDGEIYSTLRMATRISPGFPQPKPHKLKSSPDEWGYLMVALMRNGKPQTKKVHRLVCAAFHGECPDGLQCCHGPGGNKNNCPSNLEWGTPSKNQGEDRLRDGTAPRGEKSATHKLTVRRVREARRLHGQMTHEEIAKKFNVSPSTISAVVNRASWAWLDARKEQSQ